MIKHRAYLPFLAVTALVALCSGCTPAEETTTEASPTAQAAAPDAQTAPAPAAQPVSPEAAKATEAAMRQDKRGD